MIGEIFSFISKDYEVSGFIGEPLQDVDKHILVFSRNIHMIDTMCIYHVDSEIDGVLVNIPLAIKDISNIHSNFYSIKNLKIKIFKD